MSPLPSPPPRGLPADRAAAGEVATPLLDAQLLGTQQLERTCGLLASDPEVAASPRVLRWGVSVPAGGASVTSRGELAAEVALHAFDSPQGRVDASSPRAVPPWVGALALSRVDGPLVLAAAVSRDGAAAAAVGRVDAQAGWGLPSRVSLELLAAVLVVEVQVLATALGVRACPLERAAVVDARGEVVDEVDASGFAPYPVE